MLIAISAFVAYLILNLGIKKTKGKGHNLWTWVLWVPMDVILFITTLLLHNEQHNNRTGDLVLLSVFILGSLSVFISLLIWGKKSRRQFGVDEIIISIFTILTLVLWIILSSNIWGVIFGIISQFTAGLLLMKQTIKNPEPRFNLVSYLFFIMAYILTTFKSSHWEIETQLFPIVMGVCTMIETYFLFKKYATDEKGMLF